MHLRSLELTGFKSFAKKTTLDFSSSITGIVGPNGSGKSNVAEGFRFVLGEQSIKSMRGKRGEDLIFNGSKTIGRQNRASVKIILDNASRLLNIDFDEVSIERVVHRDGVNEYLINGSTVRLKDIVELLSSAHMGPSGHHIISQGEADRMLNATLRERRLMIEDALGLKAYQFKRQESERKLERTRENILQVESLRREVAPHLKFLRKQVEKVEKLSEIKTQLISLYKTYFANESSYLAAEQRRIEQEKSAPTARLVSLEKELAHAAEAVKRAESHDGKKKEILELEAALRAVRSERDTEERALGRVEGALHSEQRRYQTTEAALSVEEHRTIPLSDVRSFSERLSEQLRKGEMAGELGAVRSVIREVLSMVSTFIGGLQSREDRSALIEIQKEITNLDREKLAIEKKLEHVGGKEEKLQAEYARLQHDIAKDKDIGREAERKMFSIMSEQNSLRAALALIKASEERLRLEEDEYKRELGEAAALLGRDAIQFSEGALVAEERGVQGERRRAIEKMKIRIEEMGGVGDDVLKEYEEVRDRDAFLEKEITDLHASAEALEKLIRELTERLDIEFREGVRKINAQFGEYFKLMFGGGHAELSLVREEKRRPADDEDLLIEAPSDEEEVAEEGLEVRVNLPHKKIRSLEMLSGGERALTSIALLFAISQVNPPPFIILDETDAALDEANSRKYGDMIASLSKVSQLVLITHNRETMSRAGVIYGVTMGQDAVSKILSIQFEEAVKVAK